MEEYCVTWTLSVQVSHQDALYLNFNIDTHSNTVVMLLQHEFVTIIIATTYCKLHC